LLDGHLVWTSTSATGIWWGYSLSSVAFLVTCKFLVAYDARQHSYSSVKNCQLLRNLWCLRNLHFVHYIFVFPHF
jgi:hypothetical protein